MVDIPVGMYRAHMRDIPLFALPDGFVFRDFRAPGDDGSGDAGTWVRIQAAAEAQFMQITHETFLNDFGGHESQLPGRSWFVTTEKGEDVASITAWWWDTPPDCELQGRVGLIHWVARIPEYQGRKIGKAMMTKAMQRLARDHQVAYLNTSTIRIPAIRMYLDFGFLPDMKKNRADEAWSLVRESLKHPAFGNA